MESRGWEASQASGFELSDFGNEEERRDPRDTDERKGENGRRLPSSAGRKKMERLVCNMKGGLGFFPLFSFFFLAWAFEPYFILYTLPGCQAQAEVNEPSMGCLVRPASSSARSGQTRLGWDKSECKGDPREAGGGAGCSKMRKESKKASQGGDLEGLQECQPRGWSGFLGQHVQRCGGTKPRATVRTR